MITAEKEISLDNVDFFESIEDFLLYLEKTGYEGLNRSENN